MDPILQKIYNKKILGIDEDDVPAVAQTNADLQNISRVMGKIENWMDYIVSHTGTIPTPKDKF